MEIFLFGFLGLAILCFIVAALWFYHDARKKD